MHASRVSTLVYFALQMPLHAPSKHGVHGQTVEESGFGTLWKCLERQGLACIYLHMVIGDGVVNIRWRNSLHVLKSSISCFWCGIAPCLLCIFIHLQVFSVGICLLGYNGHHY